MRVLLAGASGAIGRYLVPQLLAAKHEVIGITRTAGSLADTGAREVVGDVLDRSALLAALDGIKADAVIHQLTALSKTPARTRDMRETNRLRTEGTSTLIAAARRVGAKKFVAGSFFGGYGLLDHGRTPVDESGPFGEPDGRADAVQTALLSLEQQVHAFGGVSLRFGLFYDGTTASVSPVSSTWNGVLPMLHLSDAAAATVRALAKYRPGTIYNIADDHPISYRAREIARASAAGLRRPTRLSDGMLRLAAPFGALLLTRTSIRLDTSKAHTELGWTPQYPSLLECLGAYAGASAPADLIIPRAAQSRGAKFEAGPEPDSELEPESEAEADPESETEPERAPEPESRPEPVAEKPKPIERGKDSAASTRPTKPSDLFHDTDAAIARIGVRRDD